MSEAVLLLIMLSTVMAIWGVFMSWILQRDVFAPGILLPLSYSAYTLFFVFAVLQESSLSSGYDVSGLEAYLYAQILGLLGLLAGVFFAWLIAKRVQLRSNSIHVTAQGLLTGLVFVFTTGWLLMGLLIVRFGGLASFIQVGYGAERYVIVGDVGFLGFGVDWLIVAYSLLAFVLLTGLWRLYRSFYRTILLVMGGTYPVWLYLLLVTGGRGNMLKWLLIFFLIWHYFKKRFEVRKVLILGSIVYMIFVLYGHVRVEFKNLPFLEVVMSAIQKVLDQPTILLPTSFGEFINPARALYDLANRSMEWNYWLGQSYLNIPLVMFPKLVFRDRPLTPAEWYVAQIDPAFAVSGGGLGFVTVAEGYLNFGLMGAFIHMFIVSFVLGLIYYRFIRGVGGSTPSFLRISGIIIYAFLFIAGMRIDVAPIIKTALFGYVLPLLFAPIWDLIRRGIVRTKVYVS
jgi:hypothetical protein